MAPTTIDTLHADSPLVSVLAPVGRDQRLIRRLLTEHGIASVDCADETALLASVREGRGPVVVTDEALSAEGVDALERMLADQPNWSELPVILLTRARGPAGHWKHLADRRRCVRWLRRPVVSHALVTMVRLAVDARQRQLEVDRLLREQARLNRRLSRRADQLQRMTLELMHAEDRERLRLARLLHDDLQQLLVGAGLYASIAAGQQELPEALRQTLAEVERLIARAQSRSRDLSHDLYPPVLAEGDVAGMLRWLADHARQSLGMTARLCIDGELGEAGEDLVRFLYRSLGELLCNAVKHGGVSEAVVEARRVGRWLHVTLRDQGAGFDPRAVWSAKDVRGLGLRAIRERAASLGGRFAVDSRPGSGTTVHLQLPVHDAPGAAEDDDSPIDVHVAAGLFEQADER